MEELENMSFDASEVTLSKIEVPKEVEEPKAKKRQKKTNVEFEEDLYINPLRKERVIVKFISKKQGIWGDNPKHVLAGGMSESSKKTYVVPVLSSGMYVNVLTDSEKKYLEYIMGLDTNALSIYKKENNFWDSSNSEGINKVVLTKQDNFLDLSIPEDYIKYKILLANKTRVAPSIQVLNDMPLASYEYVIIREEDEAKQAKNRMNSTMRAYMNFGKISDDKDKMLFILETILGRPISDKTKVEVIQTKLDETIQSNATLFNNAVEDEYLDTKILIKRAVGAGIIAKRNNYYYLKQGTTNEPLCDANQDSTLTNAAIYLNSPKHQDIYLAIQSKLES